LRARADAHRLRNCSDAVVTSVVIPAHNEEEVIGRCLTALVEGSAPGELEVLVVCNGCTDRTAAVAASFGEPVRVIECDSASKAAALNMGDDAASSFPRIYLDADIQLPLPGLRLLAGCLGGSGALAGTVDYRIDLSKASSAVCRFYRARSRAPYPDHLVGRGVYGLSARGRNRFSRFPPLIADDLFVQSLFRPEECCHVDSCTVTVHPPANARELIRVQSRVFAGNMEYRRAFPENPQRGSAGSLLAAHIRPDRWMDLAVFSGIVTAAKARARWRTTTGRSVWDSTRKGASAETSAFDKRAEEDSEVSDTVAPRFVLGLPISLTSWDDLERWSCDAEAARTGATVLTVAPYQAYLAKSRSDYRRCLEDASVVLVDGNGVRLLLAVAGMHPGPRLTGRELVDRLLSGRLLPGSRVAVVGASDEAREILAADHPGWTLLGGRYTDPPKQPAIKKVAAELRLADPDLVLVALGAPKQELWADALARELPRLYFCVGGAVDTATGVKRPPPGWVTRVSMEWAWRALQDPSLAGHLLRGASVMPTMLVRAFRHRLQASARAEPP
jgi:exopolysaccharide biosynthesis WecB/TagA/CpsF family protein